MDRTIKFRAWDGEFMWDDIHWLDLNKGNVFAFEGTSHGSAKGTRSGAEIVAVMQYTGLKDKNGVEIYEGDIVAIDMWHGNEHGYIPEDGVIKWHQPSSAFKWFSLEEDASDANNYWLSEADEQQREVISNIYQSQAGMLKG